MKTRLARENDPKKLDIGEEGSTRDSRQHKPYHQLSTSSSKASGTPPQASTAGYRKDQRITQDQRKKRTADQCANVPVVTNKADMQRVGERFPSMNNLFDKDLRLRIIRIAADLDIPLRTGVYWMCGGPQIETPAELRMMNRLGADAVGMSVAHEAIAARHCGMKVFGMSLITNVSQLDEDAEIVQDIGGEIENAGEKAANTANQLVRGILCHLKI